MSSKEWAREYPDEVVAEQLGMPMGRSACEEDEAERLWKIYKENDPKNHPERVDITGLTNT